MESEFLKRFGMRIYSCRVAIGMSQDELSKRLGFKTRQAVSLYERGLRNPTIEQTAKIARILGVTPNYLLGWGDDDEDA